jgi:hypothetical protein
MAVAESAAEKKKCGRKRKKKGSNHASTPPISLVSHGHGQEVHE